MLSLHELNDRQNHSFSNFSNSDERNFSKELLTKGAMRVKEILRLSDHRKLEGPIGTVDLSLIAMFSVIDFSNGDDCADSAEEVLQSKGIALSACQHGNNKSRIYSSYLKLKT